MSLTFKLSLVALTLGASTAMGHEFWIDAVDFTPAEGAPIVAELRVGENFEGSAYPFIPANFRLFELAHGADRTRVDGRIGDRPALAQTPVAQGLNVVLHVTRDYTLEWSTWEKFVGFVENKDFRGILEEHRAKGYPETSFTEVYSRHAKSLIAVGDGAGADREYGLETEIVALANPYTDDLSGGLPVRVLYQGVPRADVQVEIFAKAADGSVEVTTTRTDDGGRAIVPVVPGREYLIDAVVIRAPDAAMAEETDAKWETLWASLTFEVPAE